MTTDPDTQAGHRVHGPITEEAHALAALAFEDAWTTATLAPDELYNTLGQEVNINARMSTRFLAAGDTEQAVLLAWVAEDLQRRQLAIVNGNLTPADMAFLFGTEAAPAAETPRPLNSIWSRPRIMRRRHRP
jgi:hypothetical protein